MNAELRREIVVARKQHQCSLCLACICPGEKYERVTLVRDRKIDDLATCQPCLDDGIAKYAECMFGYDDGVDEEAAHKWAHKVMAQAGDRCPSEVHAAKRYLGRYFDEMDVPTRYGGKLTREEALNAVHAAARRGSAVNLRGADLSGINLSGVDLCGADLRDADLRDVNLRGSNLAYANLRSVNSAYANLYGADLHGANLAYADLRSADLRDADATYADLSQVNLPDASLYGANLCGTNLRNANLRRANMSNARWDGLALDGLHRYRCLLVPTIDGWHARIECWDGTVDELQALINGDVWPQSKDEQVTLYRPLLQSWIDMCRAHIKSHPNVIHELLQTHGLRPEC